MVGITRERVGIAEPWLGEGTVCCMVRADVGLGGTRAMASMHPAAGSPE